MRFDGRRGLGIGGRRGGGVHFGLSVKRAQGH